MISEYFNHDTGWCICDSVGHNPNGYGSSGMYLKVCLLDYIPGGK